MYLYVYIATVYVFYIEYMIYIRPLPQSSLSLASNNLSDAIQNTVYYYIWYMYKMRL